MVSGLSRDISGTTTSGNSHRVRARMGDIAYSGGSAPT